jgi:hypothetical protein
MIAYPLFLNRESVESHESRDYGFLIRVIGVIRGQLFLLESLPSAKIT